MNCLMERYALNLMQATLDHALATFRRATETRERAGHLESRVERFVLARVRLAIGVQFGHRELTCS
jgi:hypothetical protein